MATVVIFHAQTQGIIWLEKAKQPERIKYTLGLQIEGGGTPKKTGISHADNLKYWDRVKVLKPKAFWLESPENKHEGLVLEICLNSDLEFLRGGLIGEEVRKLMESGIGKPGKKMGMSFGLFESAEVGCQKKDDIWDLLK